MFQQNSRPWQNTHTCIRIQNSDQWKAIVIKQQYTNERPVEKLKRKKSKPQWVQTEKNI